MAFYLVLIILVLTLTTLFSSKFNNGFGYFIVSLILTVIAIIRYDVGWDYWNYYTIVDDVILAGLVHFEPFFLLLCLPAIYWSEPFLLFLLSGLIIYPLAFYSFKKLSVSPSLSLIIYVGLFYLISCSIIRQAIAVSICLYAYKYVQEKSFVKFFFIILLATLFHYSAIVSLIIYPVFYIRRVKIVVIFMMTALVCKQILFVLLEHYGLYTEYLHQLEDMGGGGLTRFFYLLIFLSFWCIIKIKGYSDLEKRYLLVIGTGLLCPYVFGASMGERIGYYFLMYFCFAIPQLLVNKYWYKRTLYISIFSAYFLLTILYTSNIPGQKSAYTPYRVIFNSKNVEFRN